MKKLLLILLALPLLFSCGGSLEQDLNKEITDAMIDDGGSLEQDLNLNRTLG